MSESDNLMHGAELEAISNDTQAVVDAATRAAKPRKLDDEGRFFTVVSPRGQIKLIDLEVERDKELYANTPRRKAGTYRVHDADSFVAYLAKHAGIDTEVWADAVHSKITGVIDAHESTHESTIGARHEEHRVEYAVLLTDAWKAWALLDGKLLDQTTLAEHLENRIIDVVVPTGAEMLELAQTIQATIGVNFESSKRLSSGERQLEYRETVEAKAGKKGQLEIPETFALALQPFEGADRFKVTARLRYRITDGALRIGYRLERPEDVLREAFLSVVAKVQDGAAALEQEFTSPIFLGSR